MINARICKRPQYNEYSDPADRCFGFCPAPAIADHLEIVTARSGSPVVRITDRTGARIHLHSTIDPEAEARLLVERIRVSQDGIYVVLGAGLGYHIDQLLQAFPDMPVAVVDYDHHMFNALFTFPHAVRLVACPNTCFVCGRTAEEIVEHLSHIQNKYGFKPFEVISHPPSLRINPPFYKEVERRVAASRTINLKRRFDYPKCKSNSLNVLILQSKYYLLAEISGALQKMGHSTRCVMIETGEEGQGSRNVIEEIINTILTFKPDFVLTVNHLGFDREGILIKFFTDIELPCVSWYVDSPVFILENYHKQLSPYLHIFLWDKDYIADLRQKGFNSVHYLPLATDPGIFRPVPASENSFNRHTCRAGFVGNSWQTIIDECFLRLPIQGEPVIDLVDTAARQFLSSRRRFPGDVQYDFNKSQQFLFDRLMNICRKTFEPLITWQATQIYRTACVRQLQSYQPVLCGDREWAHLVNGTFRLLPELNYYDELPLFYNVCEININTTSAQMKSGVNQRVFDVPACGAFLITDYRSQMEEMFEMRTETVVFEDPEEIPSLINFYCEHETERRRIVDKARQRILSEHTYEHRVGTMIETLRRIHG